VAPTIGDHTNGLAAERPIVAHVDAPMTDFAATEFAAADCSRKTAIETCVKLVISAASPTIPVPTCSP
jgi:hypothetical protein